MLVINVDSLPIYAHLDRRQTDGAFSKSELLAICISQNAFWRLPKLELCSHTHILFFEGLNKINTKFSTILFYIQNYEVFIATRQSTIYMTL